MTAASPIFVVEPFGDRAVSVRFDVAVEPGGAVARRSQVLLAWRQLMRERERVGDFAGVVRDVQPSTASVLVSFDPLEAERRGLTVELLCEQVRSVVLAALAEASGVEPPGRLVELAVCFESGGDDDLAPDLAALAAGAGLAVEEVVRRLCATPWRVAFLGFAPGFAYLDGLPPELAMPRRASPRPRVPAGSLAIGGNHVGIYPVATPGGWNLIGRTRVRLFDPLTQPPAVLAPGDRVLLRPITREAWLGEPDRVAPRGHMRPTDVVADSAVGRDSEPAVVAEPDIRPDVVERPGSPQAGWLRVLEPGALATVQDLGRPGHAHLGVSACGAADSLSLRIANRLVGNPDGAAAVEMLLVGGRFELRDTRRFALAGVGAVGRLERRDGTTVAVEPWRVYVAAPGDQVVVGPIHDGARAYLAIAGGLVTPLLLGSRSTHRSSGLGGLAGRELRRGDVLPIGELTPAQRLSSTERPRLALSAAARQIVARGLRPQLLRVLPGPQLAELSLSVRRTLLGQRGQGSLADHREPSTRLDLPSVIPNAVRDLADAHQPPEADTHDATCGDPFTVSERSDRFGIRLRGPLLNGPDSWSQLASAGAPLGALQVTPNGEAILLGPDHQTTGGYPQVAVVAAVDLPALGQLRPRDTVRFTLVTLTEAQRRLRDRHAWLDSLLAPCDGDGDCDADRDADLGVVD